MTLVPTYAPPGWEFYEFRTLQATTDDFLTTFAGTGENAYANGTFDVSTDGWTYVGVAGGSVARVTSSPAPHDGAGCLRLNGSATAGSCSAVGPTMTGLTPGSTYRIAAWIYWPFLTGPDALNLYADNGATGAKFTAADVTKLDQWQLVTLDFTVGANGQLRPYFNLNNSGGATDARIDTVTVTLIGDGRVPMDVTWQPPPYELWLVDSVSWAVNESASVAPASAFPAPALAVLHVDDPRTKDANSTYVPAPAQIVTEWANVRAGQISFPAGFRVNTGGKLGLFLRWASGALATFSPADADDFGALIQLTVLRDTSAYS